MDMLVLDSGVSRCRRSLLQLLALLVALLMSARAEPGDVYDVKCPLVCRCRLIFDTEDGTVLRVQCLSGGLTKIPVGEMDKNVYKLDVRAPEDNPNNLTIGPVFTQPIPLRFLKELYVTNSNVPSIGKYAFWGLSHLKLLNLTYNNITEIGMDNFRGLINITDMDLSYNRIHNMASETFQYCPHLKRLYLLHNNVTNLQPRLFRQLVELQILDMSGNPLMDLSPEVFKDIQQLKVLRCRKCLLSRVNAHVYHLAHDLEEIDLGYNLVKYVLVDDFQDLKELTKLYLDGNQISVIVDFVFGHNRNLRELNLAGNKLALLSPNSLTNLTRLSHLDIGHNKIDKFHLQTFAPVIASLKTLILSGNNMPLNEVAIVLQILPDLYEVGLAHLSLPEFPPNFFMYNEHLTALDISWNQLTTFPLRLLSKTKYLHKLDISNNNLTRLEEQDLQRLEAIPVVSLSHNKWHCDQCSTGQMLMYMSTTVLNGSLRDLHCRTPLKFRGMPLWNVSFDMLDECPSHEAKVSVIAGLVLVAVAALAAAAGALCLSRRRAQRYYTHEEKRRERDPEHPEELLPHTELGALPAALSPFPDADDS